MLGKDLISWHRVALSSGWHWDHSPLICRPGGQGKARLLNEARGSSSDRGVKAHAAG